MIFQQFFTQINNLIVCFVGFFLLIFLPTSIISKKLMVGTF